MKTAYASAIALAVAALTAGQALAADDFAGKTRAEVRAELAQAVRSGNTVANAVTGQTYAELFPGNYAARQITAGKTRVEVRAELAEAVREGQIVANGVTGQTYAELFPGNYTHTN